MAYHLLVFAHVAAAAIWLGAGVLMQVLAQLALSSRDDTTFMALARYSSLLGLRLFAPVSLAALAFGVAAVADGPWTFGALWIDLGLVGFAATFLTGLLLLRPAGDRLAQLMEPDTGALGPGARAAATRLLTLGRIDYVVLFVVVLDMTAKPTGDDPGILAVMAAAVVAGVATVAVAAIRGGDHAARSRSHRSAAG